MKQYIPDDLYLDKRNIKKVSEILNSVPDSCLRFSDMKTLEDAIEEIKALGEDKIADFISA